MSFREAAKVSKLFAKEEYRIVQREASRINDPRLRIGSFYDNLRMKSI